MADLINLSVVTADGVAFEDKVSYINLPTDGGSVGVLSHHAPMLCAVAAGTVRCTAADGAEHRLKVGAGIANIASNSATLLVSTAEEA